GAKQSPMIPLSPRRALGQVGVVVPVLHGPFGEDGTVQGLLKLANVPFVGAGVLGSAVGMDKHVAKRLLRDAHIPTAKFLVFERGAQAGIHFAEVKRILGLPVFVKPANLGSSVGISKVSNHKQLGGAMSARFSSTRLIRYRALRKSACIRSYGKPTGSPIPTSSIGSFSSPCSGSSEKRV